MQLLLNAGANSEARDRRGDTPLLRAASKGHVSSVKILLDNGAQVNAKSRAGDTALLRAINFKQSDVVESVN